MRASGVLRAKSPPCRSSCWIQRHWLARRGGTGRERRGRAELTGERKEVRGREGGRERPRIVVASTGAPSARPSDLGRAPSPRWISGRKRCLRPLAGSGGLRRSLCAPLHVGCLPPLQGGSPQPREGAHSACHFYCHGLLLAGSGSRFGCFFGGEEIRQQRDGLLVGIEIRLGWF